MKILRPAFAALGAFTLGTGILYTLAVCGLARLAFPARAAGSLVRLDEGGEVRGSALLGQAFSRPDRFHGRPSASAYDPAAGAPSQLGPTSSALAGLIAARRAAIEAENPDTGEPPAELLLASGSGLDPQIGPAAALFQVPRIAAALRAAGAPAEVDSSLRALVASLTKGRTLGILGEPRVSVLDLNLVLERRFGPAATRP